MQICGLHRSIYRGARLASRLATKERSDVVERRDAVARWHQARRDGLTTEQAAKAVGTPLSTLYRWAKDAPLKSRRPETTRKTIWTTKLVQAVEEWRLEEPAWGKAKIVVKLREQGFTASEATVGRILAHLVKRGAIQPVPAMRKGARTRKWAAKRRFAERLPKSAKATKPGQIVQLDTVYVTLAPGKHVKHFTAYDPVAKWTVAKAYNRATAASAAMFLDKLTADMPFKVDAIQVDGGSEFMAEFENACQQHAIKLYLLPPKSPSSTARSSAATAPGATNSTPSTTCQPDSTTSTPSSTPSSIATTPTDHTAPLAEKHPHSTLQSAKPKRPPSLICLERGQRFVLHKKVV